MNFEKEFDPSDYEIEISRESLNIPDDDIDNWVEMMKKDGMDDKERDKILSNLNATYRRKIESEKNKNETLEIMSEYLLPFIKADLAVDTPKETIKERLIKLHWSEEAIDHCFDLIEQENNRI